MAKATGGARRGSGMGKDKGGNPAPSRQAVFEVSLKGPKPAEWQSSPAVYLAGQAAIDEMDKVAIELERKWGVGRLRLLVPLDVRERFDRQRYLVNHAIAQGSLEEVRQQSARMVKAWRALDELASAKGQPVQSNDVWEVVGPAGAVYAICRSVDDARLVKPEGRLVNVYTLDEIARLLDAFPTVAKAKRVFEGAEVIRVRTHVSDPLDGLPDAVTPLNDPLPW